MRPRRRAVEVDEAGPRSRSRSPTRPSGPRPQIEASRIARARSSNSGELRRRATPAAGRRRGARGAPPGAPCRPGRGRTGRTTRRGRRRRSGAGRPARSAVSSNTMTTPEPRVAPAARVPSKVSGMSSVSGPTKTPAAPPSRIAWMRAAAGHAARELEELAQRRAELDLVHAGPLDVPRDAEQLRARGALGADRRVRRAAIAQDQRDVGQRLDVVDRGRLAEQPHLDRERRLVARLGAAALDRLEQRGLLAGDVGAGADPELDVERPARARDVVAEQVRRARLVDRVGERARGRAGTRRGGRGSRARRRRRSRRSSSPRSSANGSSSRITRSLNVPGSDSSALHTR